MMFRASRDLADRWPAAFELSWILDRLEPSVQPVAVDKGHRCREGGREFADEPFELHNRLTVDSLLDDEPGERAWRRELIGVDRQGVCVDRSELFWSSLGPDTEVLDDL